MRQDIKESAERARQYAQEKYYDASAASTKQLRSASALSLLDSAVLIVLAFGIYYLLDHVMKIDTTDAGFFKKHLGELYNFALDVILRPYRAMLFGMFFQAVNAVVIPCVVYILFRIIEIKFPKIRYIYPIIVFAGIGYSVWMLMDYYPDDRKVERGGMSLNELKYYIQNTWVYITGWLKKFIHQCSVAIMFGLFFRSKEYAGKIASCVFVVINMIVFTLFGLMSAAAGAIPLVGETGVFLVSCVKGIFNCIIISDLFMILAVGGIVKFLVDKCVEYIAMVKFGLVGEAIAGGIHAGTSAISHSPIASKWRMFLIRNGFYKHRPRVVNFLAFLSILSFFILGADIITAICLVALLCYAAWCLKDRKG